MGRRGSRDRAACRRVQCSEDDFSDDYSETDLESSRSASGSRRQRQAEGCSEGDSYSDEDDGRSRSGRRGSSEFDTRGSPHRQSRAVAGGGSRRGKARRKRVDPLDIDEDDGDEPPRGGGWPSWALWVPLVAGTATVFLVILRLGGDPTTGATGDVLTGRSNVDAWGHSTISPPPPPSPPPPIERSVM